ncbi:NAD(P)H-dependent oxidoreductase [Rhabdaerophilum calidifontis]|uniref:NAD(P)H-dependent oxidoreductase n=1 Tax=Rhabdaerophilum calidifontis TaxID=2604328 RepID=UPI00123B56C4|nr:NAD(P)H-dependent oxidoreductase [Rhabdaerophilum calidifontis]
MARKILIVRGHPDPAPGHFCDALVTAYREGAEAAGHAVTVLDIAAMDLPYLRSADSWKLPAANADIRHAQEAIARADHLVIVYPLWLGDMPALLKSFFEQVSANGFVMALGPEGRWRQGLKGKSARLIVTMGMPALVYRFYFLAHSLRSLERNVLRFAGMAPVRSSLIGPVEKGAAFRQDWLGRIRALGAAAE